MKRRFSLIVATLVLLAGLLLLGGRAFFTEGAESAADKPASSVARISPGRDSDTATRKARARQPAEKSSLTKRMLSGERVNLTSARTVPGEAGTHCGEPADCGAPWWRGGNGLSRRSGTTFPGPSHGSVRALQPGD